MSSATDIYDAIANALRMRPVKLPHRATFNHTSPEIFADNKQLERIDSDNWQIVFGRRGTGKTTILANYAIYISSSSRDKRTASIEINVNDFKSDIVKNSKKLSDREKAQIYFADFAECLANHLLQVFQDNDVKSKFYRSFVDFGQRKKKPIEDAIVAIHNSVTLQSSANVAAETSRVSKSTEKREDQRSGEIGISADAKVGVGAPTMAAALRGKAGMSGSRNSRRSDELARKDRAFKIDYHRTRALIVELLGLLELDKIVLIIDEWSELDRSARTDVQAHFADLLKTVFWNRPHFVVKIGAVRNQTKLMASDPKTEFVGLELSADIFEIDLDQLYGNEQIVTDKFFEELLFRHLVYCDDRLRDFIDKNDTSPFFGTTYFRPIDTFLSYIFRNKTDFPILIRGAGAMPRDFVEIVDDIARRKNYSVKERWGATDIKMAVAAHSVDKKLKNLPQTAQVERVYGSVVQMVEENHSRTILVARRSSSALRDVIARLYHLRLLHDVRSSEVPAQLRHRYDVYNVDLGIVYDLKKDRMDGMHEGDGCYLPAALTPPTLKAYVVGDVRARGSKAGDDELNEEGDE